MAAAVPHPEPTRPAARGVAALLALALLLAVLGPLRVAQAAPAARSAPQATAPCYAAALAALTKRGAIYSQGGYLAGDPIDPATGTYYPRTGPNSFDCSGLVWWAYAQAGITIGSTTYQQITNGVPTGCTLAHLAGAATTCWAVGDLAFLRYNGGQHVAIYVGDGQFMDCYNHATGCIQHNPARDDFYQAHWWQARRIVSGCEGVSNDPGTPSTPTPSTNPVFEQIPDLLASVALGLPWACGACAPASGQTELLPQPDPEVNWFDIGSWFLWLAVQLWNRVALPIICWLLTVAGGMLDAAETAMNLVVVAGLNGVWRLFVLLVIQLREMFLAAWAMGEAARLLVWDGFGQVLAALASVAAFLAWLGELFGLLLAMVLGLAQAVWYLLALFFALIPQILTGAMSPEAPPQVTAMETNFLFLMLRDMLDGVASSKLGWYWYALIALFYLKFGMWLIDELREVNQ